MSEKDGGGAFPVLEKFEQYDCDAGKYRDVYQPVGGMSLRDYFAAQVLDMASQSLTDPEDVARRAYAVADALLKERAK